MNFPPFLEGLSEQEYREHFVATYCKDAILTFDGIAVRFRKRHFEHAFFESSSPAKKDDTFSLERAKRMDWVKIALNDPSADIRVGYDNLRRRPATDRRVAIVKGNFVVIIRLTDTDKAEFVTCYVADSKSLSLIRKSAKWPRKPTNKADGPDMDERA